MELEFDAATTTYGYDYTDELTQQTIGTTTKAFASDAFGNLTQSADAASTLTTYAYDAAERLTGITPAAGAPATFTLDALDRPKTRTVGSAVDTYGYLASSTTTYETGSATTDALLDLDGSRLAVKSAGVVSWAIFDLHGSLVALCPASSSSLSDADRYDAWGQTIGTSGSTADPWKYRGLLDVSPTATPLYAMGARFYSPQLGTFTAEDAVQGSAVNPLSMNRFLYAQADPETLIDPDGHCPALILSLGGPVGFVLGVSACAAGWLLLAAGASAIATTTYAYCTGGGPFSDRCSTPELVAPTVRTAYPTVSTFNPSAPIDRNKPAPYAGLPPLIPVDDLHQRNSNVLDSASGARDGPPGPSGPRLQCTSIPCRLLLLALGISLPSSYLLMGAPPDDPDLSPYSDTPKRPNHPFVVPGPVPPPAPKPAPSSLGDAYSTIALGGGRYEL